MAQGTPGKSGLGRNCEFSDGHISVRRSMSHNYFQFMEEVVRNCYARAYNAESDPAREAEMLAFLDSQ